MLQRWFALGRRHDAAGAICGRREGDGGGGDDSGGVLQLLGQRGDGLGEMSARHWRRKLNGLLVK